MKTIQQLLSGMLLMSVLSLGLTACSKGGDDNPAPVDPPDPSTEVTTGVYQVVNLVGDTTSTGQSAASTIYYSLVNKKVVPASKAQTAEWDIAFSNIYNSSISCNNGKEIHNLGYGGPGKGGIYLALDKEIDAQYLDTKNPKAPVPKTTPINKDLFETAFKKVKTTPAEDQFLTQDFVQLDHFQGSGDGWAFYDFYGTLFPGKPEKEHIVYNFPRALVVRTAKGKYAKLIIYSVYKDSEPNPTIEKNGFKKTPAPYLTFKFAIQQDGSKNLDLQ